MLFLYGGAIKVNIPKNDNYAIIDVSSFRDVPDNQEIFLLESKSSNIDRNVIFDILEAVPGPYSDAIATHILDLTETPTTNTLLSLSSPSTLSYIQHDNIITFLNLISLPKFTTDILISMNVPIQSTLGALLNENLPIFDHIAKTFEIVDYSLFGEG